MASCGTPRSVSYTHLDVYKRQVQLIQMPSMAVDNKTNMGGLGYVMSANCENKEAAWELMKYITGEEAMSHEAEEGIDIPAYLSAQEGYVANFKNINAQVFMDASANGFAYPSNGNFDWTTIVDDAMQEAFGQVKTVDEAMDAVSYTHLDVYKRQYGYGREQY